MPEVITQRGFVPNRNMGVRCGRLKRWCGSAMVTYSSIQLDSFPYPFSEPHNLSPKCYMIEGSPVCPLVIDLCGRFGNIASSCVVTHGCWRFPRRLSMGWPPALPKAGLFSPGQRNTGFVLIPSPCCQLQFIGAVQMLSAMAGWKAWFRRYFGRQRTPKFYRGQENSGSLS